jgi:hypothetical protein
MVTAIPVQFFGLNITINGNPFLLAGQTAAERDAAVLRANQYQREVWDVFKQIEQYSHSDVGKLLMQEINQRTGGRSLVVVPMTPCEADARTTAELERRGTAQGEKYRSPGGRVVEGSGQGSDAVIRFEPRTFGNSACTQTADPGGHYHPDDVLFHELVHALRYMQGKSLHARLPGTGFGNIEEFYAILITNIYVAECGRSRDLRADSGPVFHEMSVLDAWSKPYYENHKDLIDRLCQSMEPFTRAIGEVARRSFNPLRARYHPELYVDTTGLPAYFDLMH